MLAATKQHDVGVGRSPLGYSSQPCWLQGRYGCMGCCQCGVSQKGQKPVGKRACRLAATRSSQSGMVVSMGRRAESTQGCGLVHLRSTCSGCKTMSLGLCISTQMLVPISGIRAHMFPPMRVGQHNALRPRSPTSQIRLTSLLKQLFLQYYLTTPSTSIPTEQRRHHQLQALPFLRIAASVCCCFNAGHY